MQILHRIAILLVFEVSALNLQECHSFDIFQEDVEKINILEIKKETAKKEERRKKIPSLLNLSVESESFIKARARSSGIGSTTRSDRVDRSYRARVGTSHVQQYWNPCYSLLKPCYMTLTPRNRLSPPIADEWDNLYRDCDTSPNECINTSRHAAIHITSQAHIPPA